MANETQIECFFKSAELAKLCQGTKDIVVNIKVTYSEGKVPTFNISASALPTVTKKAGKPKKGVKSMDLFEGDPPPPPVTGCPSPCH